MTHAHALKRPLSCVGMLNSVQISNFRGLEAFEVNNFAQINLIVGDNSVGKTTLLEAIFLTLSGSPDKALHLKQFRGLDISFQNNSGESVFDGIYADLFHDPRSLEPISVRLVGIGFENRELTISRITGDAVVPIKDIGNRKERRSAKAGGKAALQTLAIGQSISVPILLAWKDERGEARECRVSLTPAGMKFDGTGEVIPNSFLFAAQTPVSAQEAATHYTNLTKMRQADKFRRAFMSVFDDIADLSVGTASGVSTILADVPWAKQLLPLPALSGGTNRASAILLALAQRSGGVVLVDEIESGIYHTRQGRLAKALITMAVEYQSQLIMTTHSNEWLENFIEAAHGNENSIAFWRMERTRGSTVQIRRFSMSEFAGGMITGEMR